MPTDSEIIHRRNLANVERQDLRKKKVKTPEDERRIGELDRDLVVIKHEILELERRKQAGELTDRLYVGPVVDVIKTAATWCRVPVTITEEPGHRYGSDWPEQWFVRINYAGREPITDDKWASFMNKVDDDLEAACDFIDWELSVVNVMPGARECSWAVPAPPLR